MKNAHIFLWLRKDALKAAKFYTSIFAGSKITDGNFMSASLKMGNLSLILFNGGPPYRLNPAASIFIEVSTQKEIDFYWKKLLQGGGKELRCGWLTDRFGVTWQIVPKILPKLLGSPHREKADRALKAMLKMRKLDIQKLKIAFDGLN